MRACASRLQLVEMASPQKSQAGEMPEVQLLARTHVLHDRTLCLRVMQACMFWDYESGYLKNISCPRMIDMACMTQRDSTPLRGLRMVVPESLRTTRQRPELLLLAPPHLPGRGQGISGMTAEGLHDSRQPCPTHAQSRKELLPRLDVLQ